MRISYDRSPDAAYIYLADSIAPGAVSKTYPCDPREVGGQINLDFDASGKLLGIEVLDASQFLTADLLAAAEGPPA